MGAPRHPSNPRGYPASPLWSSQPPKSWASSSSVVSPSRSPSAPASRDQSNERGSDTRHDFHPTLIAGTRSPVEATLDCSGQLFESSQPRSPGRSGLRPSTDQSWWRPWKWSPCQRCWDRFDLFRAIQRERSLKQWGGSTTCLTFCSGNGYDETSATRASRSKVRV